MSPPEPLTKNEDTRSFPPIFLAFMNISKSLKTPLKFGAKNQVSLDLSGKDFKLMDKIDLEEVIFSYEKLYLAQIEKHQRIHMVYNSMYTYKHIHISIYMEEGYLSLGGF